VVNGKRGTQQGEYMQFVGNSRTAIQDSGKRRKSRSVQKGIKMFPLQGGGEAHLLVLDPFIQNNIMRLGVRQQRATARGKETEGRKSSAVP